MNLKDAKSVKNYNKEMLESIEELSNRSINRYSILKHINFHKLPDTNRHKFYISDTRMMDKEDYVKSDKLDLYHSVHDNHMEMMDSQCRLVISKCLEYCAVQGDNSKNELEFDGLIKNLKPIEEPDLDTVIDKYLTADKPMTTFTYGDKLVKDKGGVIVSSDDTFDGIDFYGSANKYELSPDMFSIALGGYIDFSDELISKLTLYTYPIGEDGSHMYINI